MPKVHNGFNQPAWNLVFVPWDLNRLLHFFKINIVAFFCFGRFLNRFGALRVKTVLLFLHAVLKFGHFTPHFTCGSRNGYDEVENEPVQKV